MQHVSTCKYVYHFQRKYFLNNRFYVQSENYTDNPADDQPDTDYQSIDTITIFLCLRLDDLETYTSSPPKTYKALL
jgi:hypothetical protein